MSGVLNRDSLSRLTLGSLVTLGGCSARLPALTTGDDRDTSPPPSAPSEIGSVPSLISARLNPISPYGAIAVGSWAPYTTVFSSLPPSSLERIPEHSDSAIFGEFPFGGAKASGGEGAMVGWMLDEERERFIADENRNGDLTDDMPATWQVARRTRRDGEGSFGVVTVRAEIAASSELLAPVWAVALFFNERSTREERGIEFSIDRYSDAVVRGPIMFGDEIYEVMVDDSAATGNFSHTHARPNFDLSLRIDLNRNGGFDDWGEELSLPEPFALNGTTYEVESLSPDGRELKIRHSEEVAEDLVAAVDFRPGAVAPTFTVTTEDGRTLNFPGDFAGEIVLLDLWASWCGPCIAEIPNLKAVYEQFHEQGFEILSVSIDEESRRERARELVAQHQVPWIHAFDSGGWRGEIVSRYAPMSIPAFYLIDGTTGRVVAALDQIRGVRLAPRVEQALKEVAR